ncbi:hypothetical protein PsorP6_016194 [Peronosclerospora sorghi]|uniref:Uncharacterized protein n=1 Tax=Peronosclerospora sorghi TaxID=230839 RepID=A0ACC0VM66_9STRA|nr:hypothetical protein PsorP6_016194 [Peronosclerospora sorghi]
MRTKGGFEWRRIHEAPWGRQRLLKVEFQKEPEIHQDAKLKLCSVQVWRESDDLYWPHTMTRDRENTNVEVARPNVQSAEQVISRHLSVFSME